MAGDEYYDEIGFDNDDIGGDSIDRWKGRKGYTDRLGFPLATRLKVSDVHYKDKYILCNKGLCCQKLGPPQKRIGAVVVQYATDKKGKLESPFRYTVKHWVFSGKKYEDLRGVNEEWPLGEHDLKITCIEEQYQQLKYVATKEAVWRQKPELMERIQAEAEAALKTIYLGSKLDNDALREHLGLDSESPVDDVDPTSDQELDDILEGID